VLLSGAVNRPENSFALTRSAAVLCPQAGVKATGTARLRVQVVEKVALQLLKLC
jgi:hypothetical protein